MVLLKFSQQYTHQDIKFFKALQNIITNADFKLTYDQLTMCRSCSPGF